MRRAYPYSLPYRAQAPRAVEAALKADDTPSGKPPDRCQERSCVWPSIERGGRCRLHEMVRLGLITTSSVRPHREQNVTHGRGWE